MTTVSLAARNGDADDSWDFAPGQFAWLRLTRSVTAEEHPFTIASSPHLPGRVEFTIRNAGDFTRGINRLKPGQPVWVDGPHGSFTSDVSSVRGRRHDRRRRRHHPDDEHGAGCGRPPRPPAAPARRRRPQPRGPAVPRRARLAARGSRLRGHRGAAAPPRRLGGRHRRDQRRDARGRPRRRARPRPARLLPLRPARADPRHARGARRPGCARTPRPHRTVRHGVERPTPTLPDQTPRFAPQALSEGLPCNAVRPAI